MVRAIRLEPGKGSPTRFAGNSGLGIESAGGPSKAARMGLGGVSAKEAERLCRFGVVRVSRRRIAPAARRSFT